MCNAKTTTTTTKQQIKKQKRKQFKKSINKIACKPFKNKIYKMCKCS